MRMRLPVMPRMLSSNFFIVVRMRLPKCLVQAEQRKHSRWKSWVLALITKSFLVKVFLQAEHRALYSLKG
jgi:hypothetical protein